jgi:hypothetical protein
VLDPLDEFRPGLVADRKLGSALVLGVAHGYGTWPVPSDLKAIPPFPPL